MHAIVDADTCVGCGLCADTCPDVFQMDNALARVIADPAPPQYEAACREAAETCPVNAISLK